MPTTVIPRLPSWPPWGSRCVPHGAARKSPATQDGRPWRRSRRRWKFARVWAWWQHCRRLVVRREDHAMRVHSLTFLLDKRARLPVIESLSMAIHFLIYLGVVSSLLGVWQGIAFILVRQMLFSLSMGSVFAPKHKGMLVLQGNCEDSSRILEGQRSKREMAGDFSADEDHTDGEALSGGELRPLVERCSA